MKKINSINSINLYILLLLLLLISLAGCSASTSQSNSQNQVTPEQQTLTVMTHDSFAVSKSVIQSFENQYHIKLQFLKSGDAGTALNKAILSKGQPLADVFYGIDNTFLSRALDENIFEVYQSPLLDNIPGEFQLDSSNHALPVDYGNVCLNYDKEYFKNNGIMPPINLEDLTKPEYKNLVVVENPATSSPGLAFLFTTIGNFSENDYLEYWKDLVNNGVLVVNNWETAYYTEFSGSSGNGTRPIVVSYDSSPAFEVIYADPPVDESPTAAITTPKSCFRQIEFVGILEGTKNRNLAEKWIDYMLSPAFQSDMPLQMFVFPVNPSSELDEIFIDFLAPTNAAISLDPKLIAQNREKWINDWAEVTLK
jgi:thiamine transport system substrate-binding protein